MATDLVSTIIQSFSPDVIKKLASTLGLEQAAARKGLSAAVPGILAGLASTASGYDGVQKLSRAMAQVESIAGRDGDILNNLLGSSKSVIESGWNIGSSVLGGSALETLSSAVAKFAGFDAGSAKRLLSFLVPVVLGFLKLEQARANLNNFGLAKLLTSQKSDFERAMPAGVRQAVKEPRPSVSQATPSDGSNPPHERASAGRAASRDWLRWLLPALVIAGAALYFLPKREVAQDIGHSATTAPQAVPQQAPAKETAQVTAATLENDIAANIERLRVALPKVNDPASAQAAVNEMREISSRLAQLKSQSQHLPAEVRKPVVDAVSAKISELNSALDRIIKQISFLNEEAKPAIDTLKTELASLSKT